MSLKNYGKAEGCSFFLVMGFFSLSWIFHYNCIITRNKLVYIT